MSRRSNGKSLLGIPSASIGSGGNIASQTAVVSSMLAKLNAEIAAVGQVTTVNDIQRILAIFNTIITATQNPSLQVLSDPFGLSNYDPFSLLISTDLNSLSLILKSLTNAFEIVQFVLKEKGFVATGLNVSVPIAMNPVKLIM